MFAKGNHRLGPPCDPYQTCFECGQIYLTARDLRRAYRAALKRMGYPGWVRMVARLATVRASRIYFCQECLHDFFWSHR